MVEIYRFREGKIVENEVFLDGFSFLKQLGAGAEAAGAGAPGPTSEGGPNHARLRAPPAPGRVGRPRR
jgi:hypothetical protein